MRWQRVYHSVTWALRVFVLFFSSSSGGFVSSLLILFGNLRLLALEERLEETGGSADCIGMVYRSIGPVSFLLAFGIN